MARVENAEHHAAASEVAPLILDLGRKRSKRVKQLRKGEGKLLADIMATVDELKTAGTIAKNAQPVIVVVTERLEGPFGIPMFGQ